MTSRKGGKPETWSRPTGTEAEGKVSEVSRGPGTWNPTVPQESIEQIASFCPAGAVVHGQLCPTGAFFRDRLLSGPRILLDVRAVAWVSKGRGTSGWHNVPRFPLLAHEATLPQWLLLSRSGRRPVGTAPVSLTALF